MNIRRQQGTALDAAAEVRWRQTLKGHLASEFPAECARFSPADLDAFIERAATRAKAYGIDESEPTAQFIVLSLTIDEHFDEIPDVRAYLEAAELDQEDKMNALLDALDAAEE